MSFRIDQYDSCASRPVFRPAPPRVEPTQPSSLDRDQLDEFLPGHVPFADYLNRNNILDRYAAAADVFRPERSGESGPAPRVGQVAERGRGGGPRLGDVPSTDTKIDRRIQVTYKFERLLPVGTRIDVVG